MTQFVDQLGKHKYTQLQNAGTIGSEPAFLREIMVNSRNSDISYKGVG